MERVDSSALTKLLSPHGWALLQALPPYDEKTALAFAEGLRKRGVDAELVAALMTQNRLRTKAADKFGDFAQTMLFTQAGYEQATRLSVAAHHARRYRNANCTRVADLGCGIGADALALAGLGLRVDAIERDEATAAIATVNLRQFENARVHHQDALDFDLAEIDGIFADPARRTRGGQRVFNPKAYEPDLDTLLALRERVPNLGVKVAPGIPHALLPSQVHAQWVSVDGAVVEAGLWFGALAPEGAGRSALVIRGDEHHLLGHPGDADVLPVQTPSGSISHYLYEPDGAVIRAGVINQVAEAIEGHLIDPSIAYITSATLHPTPFARCYRILDHFPFSLKRLRSYLRERQVGSVTIKKRGTGIVPEQLRRQLQLRGSNHATLIVTRIAGDHTAVITEPVDDATIET